MSRSEWRALLVVAVLAILPGPEVRAADPPQQFECLVEPYQSVEMASGVAGILDEVLVDRGDAVAVDQVLFRLRSDLEVAEFDLAKAKAGLAARRVERNEELYLKQMVSIHEKDEMETEAQLLALEVRLAEERLDLRTGKSPLEGVVVRRLKSPGEYVADEPILELAQIDPLRVEVVVPIRLYGKIRPGMKGEIQWEEPLQALRRSGTVTVVDPVVDAASGTLGIRLEVPNPDHELPAGTKCWVAFAAAP